MGDRRQEKVTKSIVHGTNLAHDSFMKTTLLDVRSKAALITAALAAVLAVGMPRASSQETSRTNAVIPLIVMDDVPLLDAIKNLARQAGINIIIDPRLVSPAYDANGRFIPPPSVSNRWEKMTAKQILDSLIDEHKLKIVENPATGIARISSSKAAVKPVASSEIPTGRDTNAVFPLIIMEDVPLNVAISNLAT